MNGSLSSAPLTVSSIYATNIINHYSPYHIACRHSGTIHWTIPARHFPRWSTHEISFQRRMHNHSAKYDKKYYMFSCAFKMCVYIHLCIFIDAFTVGHEVTASGFWQLNICEIYIKDREGEGFKWKLERQPFELTLVVNIAYHSSSRHFDGTTFPRSIVVLPVYYPRT